MDEPLKDQYSPVKVSYLWPFIVMVGGIILLSIYGLKPYEDWYKTNFSWIKVPAIYEKAYIKVVAGPKSVVAKDTGSRLKVKLVLRYQPRKLFGSAVFDQYFPSWLKLPNQAFLWTESRETYDGLTEAQKAMADFMVKKDYYVYINPQNPNEAVFYTWNKWLLIQLGLLLVVISFLGFGAVLIINTKRDTVSEKRRQEELDRQSRRRHFRPKNPPPPQ